MVAPAIGIDLGISNTCVAIWQNARVEIIVNENGNRTTPSWVTFTEKQIFVGDDSKRQAMRNLNSTVYDIKRLIGRKFSDKTIQNKLEHWPFKVILGEDDTPLIEVSFKGEVKQFNAQTISSMVLSKMKKRAGTVLGTNLLKDAVITVPAYFNINQRQATKEAAELAGLNVLGIINEPTAAAIAYALHIKDSDCNESVRNILVFDLGDDTFDVSLVVVDRDIFQVKAIGGNTNLGGLDFDSKMVDYFVTEIKRKFEKDISENKRALAKLRAECERAKHTLSTSLEAPIYIECLYGDTDFSSTIYRDQFETMNMSMFRECIASVKTCLKDAKMDKGDIDDVVLVGGLSRIPKVKKLLRELFDGKELCQGIHPDETVAYGAAIHAAVLSGARHNQHKLLDITPLSLGIELKTLEVGKQQEQIESLQREISELKYQISLNKQEQMIAGTVSSEQMDTTKNLDNHFVYAIYNPGVLLEERDTTYKNPVKQLVLENDDNKGVSSEENDTSFLLFGPSLLDSKRVQSNLMDLRKQIKKPIASGSMDDYEINQCLKKKDAKIILGRYGEKIRNLSLMMSIIEENEKPKQLGDSYTGDDHEDRVEIGSIQGRIESNKVLGKSQQNMEKDSAVLKSKNAEIEKYKQLVEHNTGYTDGDSLGYEIWKLQQQMDIIAATQRLKMAQNEFYPKNTSDFLENKLHTYIWKLQKRMNNVAAKQEAEKRKPPKTSWLW